MGAPFIKVPAPPFLQKGLMNFRTFKKPSAICDLCFGSKFLGSDGLGVVCVLARKVIKEFKAVRSAESGIKNLEARIQKRIRPLSRRTVTKSRTVLIYGTLS